MVILFALTSLSVFAGTGGFVENQNVIASSAVTPQMDVSLGGPIHGKLGWSFWGLATQTWSESFVGLTYSPSDTLNVGFAYGVEDAKRHGRYGASLWTKRENVSLLALYEDGGSGPWHKAVLNYSTGKWDIGLMNQAFVGTGPRVARNFGKLSVWSALLFEKGGQKGILGITRNF